MPSVESAEASALEEGEGEEGVEGAAEEVDREVVVEVLR